MFFMYDDINDFYATWAEVHYKYEFYRNLIIDNIYHGMIINNAFKVLKTLVI